MLFVYILGQNSKWLQEVQKRLPVKFFHILNGREVTAIFVFCKQIADLYNENFVSAQIFLYVICLPDPNKKKWLKNRPFLATAKISPATIFGPPVAILNFALKCNQTEISQELNWINKFYLDIFLSHNVPKLWVKFQFLRCSVRPTHSCITLSIDRWDSLAKR